MEVAEQHISVITIDSYMGLTWNAQIVQNHAMKHWIVFVVVVPNHQKPLKTVENC